MRWIMVLAVWALSTLVHALIQWFENRRHGTNGPFWAPVWWIALTWPIWVVIIALNIPWAPQPPRKKDPNFSDRP